MVIRFFLLFTLLSCSTKQRDILRDYRNTFAQGQIPKAQELLEQSGIGKDEKSRLVYLLEKGSLEFYQRNFSQAVFYFEQAKTLVEALYTKSLSQKVATYIINDNSESYYGSAYEHSFIYYYLARAYFEIYQSNKIVSVVNGSLVTKELSNNEARTYLYAARSQLLAWDSFFQDYQRTTQKKTIYIHDLTAKTFAAQLHEATGLRNDLQISLQLYKDAFDLLVKVGPSFQAFNSDNIKSETGIRSRIAGRKSLKRMMNLKTASSLFKTTKEYLSGKILALTKRLRPNELKQMMKLYQSKGIPAKLRSNITVLLESSLIPLKKAQTIKIGLDSLVADIKDKKTRAQVKRFGVDVITAFANSKLGLSSGAKGFTPGKYVFASAVTSVAVSEAAIEFEIPTVEEFTSPEPYEIVVLDVEGKEVQRSKLPLIGSVSDIATQVIREEASSRTAKSAVRVGLKYLTAIVGAVVVYSNMNNADLAGDNFIAQAAAMATFLAASKAIAATERADTRNWMTLPGAIYSIDMNLPEGSYQLQLGKDNQSVQLGNIEATKKHSIFAYRKL